MVLDLSSTSTQIPCTFSVQRNYLPGSQSTDADAPADEPEPKPRLEGKSSKSHLSRTPTPVSSPPVSSGIVPLPQLEFKAGTKTTPRVPVSGTGSGTDTMGKRDTKSGSMSRSTTATAKLDDDEFDDIMEATEYDFQQMSSTRKRSPRVRSSVPNSDIDHIDISGASSPPMTRRSPIRPPSSPTQSVGGRRRPKRIADSQDDDAEPSPPISRSRRKAALVSEDDDDDDDVPLMKRSRGKTPAKKDKGKGREYILDSAEDDDDDDEDMANGRATRSASKAAPRSRSRKGKERAMSDEDNDSWIASDNEEIEYEQSFGRTGSTRSAADNDEDDDDQTADYRDEDKDTTSVSVPFPGDGVGIPDFRGLPSTYPRRTPTPEPPIVVFDSDSDSDMPQVLDSLSFLRKPRTQAAGAGPVEIKFTDLKLIPELDERWQQFYRDHWRRGADEMDNERDHEMDASGFGVAAPAGAAKRASFKSRGWGRGRGRWGRGKK